MSQKNLGTYIWSCFTLHIVEKIRAKVVPWPARVLKVRAFTICINFFCSMDQMCIPCVLSIGKFNVHRSFSHFYRCHHCASLSNISLKHHRALVRKRPSSAHLFNQERLTFSLESLHHERVIRFSISAFIHWVYIVHWTTKMSRWVLLAQGSV